MADIQRADRLKTPPMLGRFYMVPAIMFDWGLYGRKPIWWPVLGHKHTDAEFLNFHYIHYHVDPRFMGRRHWSYVAEPYWSSYKTKFEHLLARPLHDASSGAPPLPKPTMRRMKCSMVEIPYPFGDREQIVQINEAFADKQCHKGKRGWVCPHKHIALGSIAPIDGVITCPLHGMRIDAATGKCLGPLALRETPR